MTTAPGSRVTVLYAVATYDGLLVCLLAIVKELEMDLPETVAVLDDASACVSTYHRLSGFLHIQVSFRAGLTSSSRSNERRRTH